MNIKNRLYLIIIKCIPILFKSFHWTCSKWWTGPITYVAMWKAPLGTHFTVSSKTIKTWYIVSYLICIHPNIKDFPPKHTQRKYHKKQARQSYKNCASMTRLLCVLSTREFYVIKVSRKQGRKRGINISRSSTFLQYICISVSNSLKPIVQPSVRLSFRQNYLWAKTPLGPPQKLERSPQ